MNMEVTNSSSSSLAVFFRSFPTTSAEVGISQKMVKWHCFHTLTMNRNHDSYRCHIQLFVKKNHPNRHITHVKITILLKLCWDRDDVFWRVWIPIHWIQYSTDSTSTVTLDFKSPSNATPWQRGAKDFHLQPWKFLRDFSIGKKIISFSHQTQPVTQPTGLKEKMGKKNVWHVGVLLKNLKNLRFLNFFVV